MDDTSTASRPFLLDRIAGSVMVAGFVAMSMVWLWNTRNLTPMFPGQEGRSPSFPTSLGYLSAFLGFALQVWYSVGVFKGLRWAFIIATMVAAQKAVDFVNHSQLEKLGLESQILMAFTILIFAYCGLRLVGSFGPQIMRLLPARDETRYAE